MKKKILIKDLRLSHRNKTITIQGWISDRRPSEKIYRFTIRDETGTLVAVASEKLVGKRMLTRIARLSVELTYRITGVIHTTKNILLGYEIHPRSIRKVRVRRRI